MKRHKQTIVYKGESRLFYGALFSCIAVVIVYAYFVSLSVIDVVMRKETNAQIAQYHSTLSGLEAEYIELQHAVSSDVATMRGFVSPREKYFIDTSTETLVLSGN